MTTHTRLSSSPLSHIQSGRRGATHEESRSSLKEANPVGGEKKKRKLKRRRGGARGALCLCETERECVRLRVGREGKGERAEEVWSGPLLLPWRPHPDAAAAVGAGGRSKSVCSLEERRRAEGPHTQTDTAATSKASGSIRCTVGLG